jgi:hypothetical protein
VTVEARNVTAEALANLAGLTASSAAGPLGENGASQLTFHVASDDDVSSIVRHLVGRGAEVYRVSPQTTSLEDEVGEDRGL